MEDKLLFFVLIMGLILQVLGAFFCLSRRAGPKERKLGGTLISYGGVLAILTLWVHIAENRAEQKQANAAITAAMEAREKALQAPYKTDAHK